MKLMYADMARICHEAIRAMCLTSGETPDPAWDECIGANAYIRDSAIANVEYSLENQSFDPIDAHRNWRYWRERDGWTLGPTKDRVLKRHPCLVSWADLSEVQRNKDRLWQGVLKTLAPMLQNDD